MGFFSDAIKAMFTRNTTNAASVSGARVPFVQANGDPIGNDTIANLGQVLGATRGVYSKALNTVALKIKINTAVTHASTFHIIAPAGARCLDIMIYMGSANSRMPAVQLFITRGYEEEVEVNNGDRVYYEISGDFTYVYVISGGSASLLWNVNYTTNRSDTTIEALNSVPNTSSMTPAKKIHYSWDVPSFYKSYNTLAELKAALANV